MSMSEKRIILAVTNDLVADQRIQRISASLAQEGHQVTVVGRISPRKPQTQYHPNVVCDRLHIPFQRGWLFYACFNVRLFFHLLFSKADLLCANDADTLLAVGLVSKIRGIPFIYDSHEYFTEVPELAHKPLVKKSWHLIQKYFVPKAKACMTVGSALAEELSRVYGKKFQVVRNAAKERPAPLAQKLPILLYQGVLNKGRGLEQCIDAMETLTDLELWIVGRGDIEDQLKRQVQQKQLSNVRFLGFVPPEELRQITDQAWLGLNLLDSSSLNYHFSLANKWFDYLQAEVVSLHMTLPEYVRLRQEYGVGVLIEQLETTALIQSVRELQINTSLYEDQLQHIRHAKKLLNWEHESKSLVQIYRDSLLG